MPGGPPEVSRQVNYHQYIRNLVVDGQMKYSDVLDLTTTQIAALLTKESLPPGSISEEMHALLKQVT